MKNIREYEFWDNSVFGSWRRAEDNGERCFIIGMTAIIALLPAIGLSAIIDVLLFGGSGVGLAIGMPLGFILIHLCTRLSRVYKGYGLPTYTDYSYSGGRAYNFPERAREYFSLPKADRSLYPHNIIEIMRNPDLEFNQRAVLNTKMRGLYAGIQERDKQKRLLTNRDVDIEHILEYMNDSRRGLDSDIETYKEFA